jgi:hypothetical protein
MSHNRMTIGLPNYEKPIVGDVDMTPTTEKNKTERCTSFLYFGICVWRLISKKY